MLQDIQDWFTAERIQTIALAIVILVATLIARRLLPRLMRKGIHGMRRTAAFTRFEQGIWSETLGDKLLPPVRLLVTVIGIWALVIVLGVPDAIADWVPDAFASLVAIAVFWAGYQTSNYLFDFYVSRARDDQTTLSENLLHFGARMARGVIVVIAFTIIVSNLGYDLPGLLTGLGLTGLAIALAAQDALSNLIGYFVIMADQPFKVGDYVITDKAEGTIESIGFRTTRIRRPDRAVLLVPNNIMTKEVLTNWSLSAYGPRRGQARLNMTLGITYGTKADQVLTVVKLIREMLTEHERVVAESVIVHFVSFGDSSLDIMVVCTIRMSGWSDLQGVKEDINISIMRILDVQGVSVAFPTRTVILEQPTPDELSDAD